MSKGRGGEGRAGEGEGEESGKKGKKIEKQISWAFFVVVVRTRSIICQVLYTFLHLILTTTLPAVLLLPILKTKSEKTCPRAPSGREENLTPP